MNPFGYDLPSGVTQTDIDIFFGAAIRCPSCRRVRDADVEECQWCANPPEYDRMEEERREMMKETTL